MVYRRRFSTLTAATGLSVLLSLASSHASLSPVVAETGRISFSIDGVGSNDPTGGDVDVLKPPGATVRRAFIACAAVCCGSEIPDGGVSIAGVSVSWDANVSNGIFPGNTFADVTSALKPTIDNATAGRLSFHVVETDTFAVDGCALGVIFDDPSQSRDRSVSVLFGGQATGGDSFTIALSRPLDLSDPATNADMGLGISFGAQDQSGAGGSHLCGTQSGMDSQIDVNGVRLTSCAGNADDGVGSIANGMLLTVGGLDDANANPFDAMQRAADGGLPRVSDDELYTLKPFVRSGDTIITVNTINPSSDDNIVLAYFVTLPPAVVGQGIVLTPEVATNPLGTQHAVVARVFDDHGQAVVGKSVTFTVLTGPNAGLVAVQVTDGSGQASFTFRGDAAGTDTIQATFLDSNMVLRRSNIATKTWEQQTVRKVVAGTGARPSEPTSEEREVDGALRARFPLGAVFFIGLTDSDDVGVDARFTLEQQQVAPVLTGPSLFPNSVVVAFGEDATSELKFFQALHLGTAKLTITPADGSAAVVLTIEINRPRALGSTHAEVDTSLSEIGHRRGIPPQMLKGQIQRESDFVPVAYRYEPLTVDYSYISRGQNLRTSAPYNLYRLKTSDGLAQGVKIVDADISPRSRFCIRRDRQIRSILPTDTVVSTREIYEMNDLNAPMNPLCRREHWSDCSGCDPQLARSIGDNPKLLEFTAQTPLAASYGYLQILYSTADKPMRWVGVSGARNPSLLFDTEDNLRNGGGSLDLGSGYLRRVLGVANTGIDPGNPTFCGRAFCGRTVGGPLPLGSSCDLEAVFRRAFNYYNHGGATGMYGAVVLTNACRYPPQQATSIFP